MHIPARIMFPAAFAAALLLSRVAKKSDDVVRKNGENSYFY